MPVFLTLQKITGFYLILYNFFFKWKNLGRGIVPWEMSMQQGRVFYIGHQEVSPSADDHQVILHGNLLYDPVMWKYWLT